MPKYFLVFSSGLIVSLLLMILLRKLALRFKMLVSKEIALVGGIGVGVAVMISSLLGIIAFGVDPTRILAVVAASFVILIFGVLDDLREETVFRKFLLQVLCATLLIGSDIRTHIIYLNDFGNITITYIWILGITNAFNLLDTIDGLSSGVALIVTGAIVVISFLNADPVMQILSLGLAAAILGFWFFNLPPAKIYLGNSGSHFLGFIIAALTLMLQYAMIETPAALVSPIIILWLALLETALLIYFRLKKGILPFNKSKDHIALRLIALGLTPQRALFLMLGLALFFSFCGIIISRSSNFIVLMIVLLVIVISFSLFRFVMKAEHNGQR